MNNINNIEDNQPVAVAMMKRTNAPEASGDTIKAVISIIID
jgi:hypothetical protein